MKILWRFVPRIPGFGRISEKNNAGELIIHVPDNLEGISTSLGTGTLYMCDIRTGELDISIGTGTADIQGI